MNQNADEVLIDLLIKQEVTIIIIVYIIDAMMPLESAASGGAAGAVANTRDSRAPCRRPTT